MKHKLTRRDNAFNVWLAIGIAEGYCSEPFCGMHDLPAEYDDAERADYDDGNDVCMAVVRIHDTPREGTQ